MASSVHSCERELSMRPKFSSNLSIDAPIHQRLARERLPAAPFHIQCPLFVPHPVRAPVISSSVNQHSDPSLQQFRHVGRNIVQRISGCIKGGIDSVTP